MHSAVEKEKQNRSVYTTSGCQDKVHEKLLPLTKEKKQDLVHLCKTGVIPEELHGWYA
jgi:hypothetical protein